MPLPENNILFYWTAPNGALFCALFRAADALVRFGPQLI